MVTAVAVVIGGAMLGLVGALVAIPLAAALLLVLKAVLFPAGRDVARTAFTAC